MHRSEKMNGIATTGMFSWMEEKSMYTAHKNHVAQKCTKGILHATLALRNITPVTTVSFMSQIYTGAARDATVKGFELILIFFFFLNAQHMHIMHINVLHS